MPSEPQGVDQRDWAHHTVELTFIHSSHLEAPMRKALLAVAVVVRLCKEGSAAR
jgi:hypothetical protein